MKLDLEKLKNVDHIISYEEQDEMIQALEEAKHLINACDKGHAMDLNGLSKWLNKYFGKEESE